MKPLPVLRTAAVALAAVALAVAASAHADTIKSRFHFTVPSGWTDKSPADTRDYLTLAVDDKDELVFQASVRPGAGDVTPDFLDKYAAAAQQAVAKRLKGAELKVLKKSTFTIAGVTVGRFLFEMPPPPGADEGDSVRQLQFYVPAVDQAAVLTFTAPKKSYKKFEPLFDKTARATTIRK